MTTVPTTTPTEPQGDVMLCGHMIPLPNQGFVPCGQCYACRVNRLRKTVGQILLEAAYSEKESTFLTLTYNDAHYPSDGSLRPDHSYNFIDRLRKKTPGDKPLRYFCVGEYGSKTERAHYHLALFNLPPEEAEGPAASVWTENGQSRGFIKVGTISPESAAYIAGYCTKKMGRNDPRLDGRYPEFNRRSKYPPLGAKGVEAILDSLHTNAGSAALAKQGTIPTFFRYQGQTYPLSDYWRNYLAEETGFPAYTGPKPWQVDFQAFLEDQAHAQKKSQLAQKRHKSKARSTI